MEDECIGLCPHSWHRAPETLVMSWMTGVSYVLTGCLWMSSAGGLDTRQIKPRLEAWNFQLQPIPHPPDSGGGTRNGVKDQSRLREGESIKMPTVEGSESFQAGKHTHVLRS